MKHKKVSQLLAASLSFLMIAMLCVSSVAMEPSMRIGSVTVHSSLFAKMASESPEKDLITQSNIVKAKAVPDLLRTDTAPVQGSA